MWAAVGIAAALGTFLPASAALSQDWVPRFPSDEARRAAVLEGDQPKSAKRATVQAPRSKPRYASTPRAVSKAPARPVHKLAIQVADNNPQVMNLALNNARNVAEHFKATGDDVAIVVVTFGPGLHMLRDDTIPVKQRIAATTLEYANITFVACANTRANMSKQESKTIDLITEARVEPSGVVHLMELKGRGYAYMRP
jgi:intracellular sulfur oxidation DsrE/DsrF family protein